jgi:CRP/FNR family cyclic AMP-dependent transcriptional regulator
MFEVSAGPTGDPPPVRAVPGPEAIVLLDADPAFASAIPTADHPLARRVLTVPLLSADRGPWVPPPRATWRQPVVGLLVVSGAIGRDLDVAGRVGTQFAAPGDVLVPWTTTVETLPYTQSFTVHEPATLAVLERRFALAASRWSGLSAVITERLAEQVLRASVHAAIAQLPRVEQRVLASLWQLAESFGRVQPDGVVIELRLTHALIGQCVGARRPTVSLAIRALLDAGLLRRRTDGAWILHGSSTPALEL